MKLKPSSHMLTYRPAPPAFTVPILYRYCQYCMDIHFYTVHLPRTSVIREIRAQLLSPVMQAWQALKHAC